MNYSKRTYFQFIADRHLKNLMGARPFIFFLTTTASDVSEAEPYFLQSSWSLVLAIHAPPYDSQRLYVKLCRGFRLK